MKITKQWLIENRACEDGQKWFFAQKERNGLLVVKKLINLGTNEALSWADWLVARLLNPKNRIRYSIFEAEQVLDIFEKIYPNDKRPRLAIEAAKTVLKHNTPENRSAAKSASNSAARSAVKSAWTADYAAESAARSAAKSAWTAAKSAAKSVWTAAEYAEESARSERQAKILNYGIELLEKQ